MEHKIKIYDINRSAIKFLDFNKWSRDGCNFNDFAIENEKLKINKLSENCFENTKNSKIPNCHILALNESTCYSYFERFIYRILKKIIDFREMIDLDKDIARKLLIGFKKKPNYNSIIINKGGNELLEFFEYLDNNLDIIFKHLNFLF